MKIYVAARFKGLENKSEIEGLCSVVRSAGADDFLLYSRCGKLSKEV